jgi:hypothetical protein
MIRAVIGAMLLASSSLPVFATSLTTGEDARSLPMTFEWRREGPADECGTKCRTWISAIGAISSDTPRKFEVFAKARDVRGAVMVVDSGGGSVLGTLELGRMLRRLDIATTVGKTLVLSAEKGAEPRVTLSPKADCESMCAFLLLAGTRRYVPPEAKVLVHQIWLGDRRDDATAASYSAEDVMVIQRDIGRLVQYTAEMGGGADLIETALRIPPWERLRPLTAEELIRAKLDTGENLFEPAPAEPPAASSASTTATPTLGSLAQRGWSMVDRLGRPMLVRRHPLTSEGEEIGSFDLIFGCGGQPNTYTATYSENRKRPGARRSHVALKDVSISVGREQAALRIVSSEPTNKPPELISAARGVVTASLMKGFADGGTRSLTIETATTNNQETAIRVGNTGLARHFAKFAAACAK